MSFSERAFLWASWAVIGAAAVLMVPVALRIHAPRPDPPAAAPETEPPAPPPAPPPEPSVAVAVGGRLVDLPGFPVDPGLLRAIRLTLRTAAGEVGEVAGPASDGTFRLAAAVPLRGLRLRIDLFLRLPQADRALSMEFPVDRPVVDLGDVPLPRGEGLGALAVRVVDALGGPLCPQAVDFEPAATAAQAPAGPLSLPASAPTLYLRGHQATILRVPPGAYRLRARVHGRRIPPIQVFVGARDQDVVLTETASRRRLLGTVRDASTRAPLGDVDIRLDVPGEPDWVQGRSSSAGLFDLPAPDPMPAGGLTATFARRGFRGTDVRLRGDDLAPGGAGRFHVELAPY